MEVIIGQVENTFASSQYLTEGNRNSDMHKINPILYAPDQGYWSISILGKYMEVFIGEVIESHINVKCLINDKPDIQ